MPCSGARHCSPSTEARPERQSCPPRRRGGGSGLRRLDPRLRECLSHWRLGRRERSSFVLTPHRVRDRVRLRARTQGRLSSPWLMPTVVYSAYWGTRLGQRSVFCLCGHPGCPKLSRSPPVNCLRSGPALMAGMSHSRTRSVAFQIEPMSGCSLWRRQGTPSSIGSSRCRPLRLIGASGTAWRPHSNGESPGSPVQADSRSPTASRGLSPRSRRCSSPPIAQSGCGGAPGQGECRGSV